MRAGVGVHLPKSALSDWPALLDSAWRDDALRDRARTLGRRLAAVDGAARAADVAERLAQHSVIPKEDHDYANVSP